VGYFTSCARAIVVTVSTALHWIAVSKLNICYPTYITDVFMFDNSTYASYERDLTVSSDRDQDVGVPQAEEKLIQKQQRPYYTE